MILHVPNPEEFQYCITYDRSFWMIGQMIESTVEDSPFACKKCRFGVSLA